MCTPERQPKLSSRAPWLSSSSTRAALCRRRRRDPSSPMILACPAMSMRHSGTRPSTRMPPFTRSISQWLIANAGIVEPMKTLLIASLVVLFSSCATPKKPAPATPAPVAGGAKCDEFICGTNGTHATGLSNGDQAGAIRTIALPCGEVITLR
jgi:hypothetical protein